MSVNRDYFVLMDTKAKQRWRQSEFRLNDRLSLTEQCDINEKFVGLPNVSTERNLSMEPSVGLLKWSTEESGNSRNTCITENLHTKLSIVYLNVNGLKRVFNLFEKDFTEFIKKHDIVALVETHLKSEYEIKQVAGYQTVSKVRTTFAGGGITVYLKNKFKCSIVYDQEASCDVLAVKINVSEKENVVMVCAYLAPYNSVVNVDDKETFEKLTEIVQRAKSDGYVLLCGDFNARIADLEPKAWQEDSLLENESGIIEYVHLQNVDNQHSRPTARGKKLIEFCNVNDHLPLKIVVNMDIARSSKNNAGIKPSI
ncbi:uncharacterized protein LOC129590189 isoform X2 [Paramacrobiotus metropolitanus]|uniref:uncharacterized protein LOC129590189 isoform X2 n=1 Tax=Paramacrobiotus metropolitanus TaxID=2943436 RepID=UPI002445E6EA|nr:uncharacterized protein LOC129590189 isoform X2 [Paramacrobiotus metropolitanus]XP_055341252.1 uncharacterized protein LOC129590189 isoform X2 [Paramacrobiotus metropolitanus]